MKKKIFLFGGTAIAFLLLGIYFNVERLKIDPPETTASGNFFEQTLPDAYGKSHKLSQWQGKPLLVNFWATWCAPCVEEMPELSALQAEIASKDMQIVGIGIDSAAKILEFSSKYKIDYPLYVAGMSGTKLSQAFGNQAGGLPFTVLIGSDGAIKKTYLGRLKMEELRKDLAAL